MISYEERTFRLLEKDGKYVWMYDDNNEVYRDKIFDTKPDAEEYMTNRTKEMFVVQTPIKE